VYQEKEAEEKKAAAAVYINQRDQARKSMAS